MTIGHTQIKQVLQPISEIFQSLILVRYKNIKDCFCTLVIVLYQVLLVYVEVMVCVQLPELAVDNVEMFIGEEICELVHVFFLLKQCQILGQKTKTVGQILMCKFTLMNYQYTVNFS